MSFVISYSLSEMGDHDLQEVYMAISFSDIQ